jgi:hypothetical protein
VKPGRELLGVLAESTDVLLQFAENKIGSAIVRREAIRVFD